MKCFRGKPQPLIAVKQGGETKLWSAAEAFQKRERNRDWSRGGAKQGESIEEIPATGVVGSMMPLIARSAFAAAASTMTTLHVSTCALVHKWAGQMAPDHLRQSKEHALQFRLGLQTVPL